MLVALVGVAALACGSVPADVDGGAQDATVADATDACGPFCFDALTQSDGSGSVVCPDAGYFITINGDGVAQTLTSSFHGVPEAYFIDCCGYTAFGIAGSQNPDGGASVQLEQASSKNADGGLTFLPGPDIVAYHRSDGTGFGSWDASLTTVYTQLDPPGGLVAGSYAVTVAASTQPDAATLSLSGTFLTCHVDDVTCGCPPPPAP